MTTPSPDPAAAELTDSAAASRPASPASTFATALLAEFLRLGVRDLVLSPGSRSQALGLAAARFEAAGLLRLHVRIDERSAGFLALGLAIESAAPVLIVTTSGTAVANLHPAVLEAAHSGIPLVVLSADRPEELREIRSNQTTRQSGIFAGVAPNSWDVAAPTAETGDAEAAALAREVLEGIAGPRHVNLAFREPLSGPVELPEVVPGTWFPAEQVAVPTPVLPGPRTVVVAGSRAGEQAEAAARALGAPLLAEIASGAHFGPNLVPAYRELLNTEGFGDRVERVIVFGHPTLSREGPALIERGDVETVVVRSPGVDDYNPGRRVGGFADAIVVPDDADAVAGSRAWVGSWVAASRELLAQTAPASADLSDLYDYSERARFAREQLGELRASVTRRALVEAVWNATWPHDRLVVGASRLIRELDKVAPGKKIPVHANRGLAGIDGTIATATGIALAAQREATTPGVTRVLLGDLSFLHDVGSLLGGAGEEWPHLQVIVGNDGGGTIFDGLEVARSAEPALVDRVLLTPQRVDLRALAEAYGWEYRRVENRGDLDGALTASGGRVVIEIPLER
jgi:2-succinyl-5-enolpyruvyl-6-hydroxy-3-cyclohexene-1-carboxylate synthase